MLFSDHIKSGNVEWLRECVMNQTHCKHDNEHEYEHEYEYEPLALHLLAGSKELNDTQRIETAKLLLSKNYTCRNVRHPDNGNTALHIAAEIPLKGFLGFLLSIGSDTTLKNHMGLTCLDVACTKFVKKMIQQQSSSSGQLSFQLDNDAASVSVKTDENNDVDESELSRRLHVICRRNDLFYESEVKVVKLLRPKPRKALTEVHQTLQKIIKQNNGTQLDAKEYIRSVVDNRKVTEHHASLLHVVVLCSCDDSSSQIASATSILKSYVHRLAQCCNVGSQDAQLFLDPIFFFAKYSLMKMTLSRSNSSFVSKKYRAACVDCLAAFMCFPMHTSVWFSSQKEIDKLIKELGGIKAYNDNDGDYNSGDEDVAEDDTGELASRWIRIKKNWQSGGSPSKAMDSLMSLSGLQVVKEKCLCIFDNVLLVQNSSGINLKKMPDRNIALNFLLVGNRGVGKTTVAKLVSRILTDVGIRSRDALFHTDSNEILNMPNPIQSFVSAVSDAEGGVVFIDDVNFFHPSPKESFPNDSNKVLNHLAHVTDSMSRTTSFIICGSLNCVEKLANFNCCTLEISDFTEQQLCQIFRFEVKERNFVLQSTRDCEINITLAASRQLGRGRGHIGFMNGLSVRTYVDGAVARQGERLTKSGDLKGGKCNLLTKEDVLGTRPDFNSCTAFQKVNSMIGLSDVKDAIRALVEFVSSSFDREMRGECREMIKLHRVFLGNPGTGKTKVARLFGEILKSLGLLSDGSIIEKKAAELIGNAVQVTGSNVRELLLSAKGKVLFIDEAYGWDPGPSSSGNSGAGNFKREAIEALMALPEHVGGDMAIILAGYKDKMDDMFRNSNPGLRSRFDYQNAIVFDDFSDEELKAILIKMLNDEQLFMEENDVSVVVKSVISTRRKQSTFGNAREIENALVNAKIKKAGRLARDVNADPNVFIPSDFSVPDGVVGEESLTIFEDNEMEDIPEVTTFIQSMADMQFMATQNIPGCPSIEEVMSNKHFLFLGPPGTGKTTVAKKMAGLLKRAGVLPTSDCEVVDASSLMGGFIGSSAPLVLSAMRRAVGGVLLIDEAYDLTPSSSNFGKDVIETLVQNILKDEFKGKLVVILAGYECEMNDFLLNCGNPGFVSRFCKERILFQSWSAEKAVSALVKKAVKSGIVVDSLGEAALLQGFQHLVGLPFWSSARDVFEVVKPKLDAQAISSLSKKLRLLSSPCQVDYPKNMEYSASDIKIVMTALADERRQMNRIELGLKTTNRTVLAPPSAIENNIVTEHYECNVDEHVEVEGFCADESEFQWQQMSVQQRAVEEGLIASAEVSRINALNEEIKQVEAAIAAASTIELAAKLAVEKSLIDDKIKREAEEHLKRETERRLLEQLQLQELMRKSHEATMLAKVRRLGKCQAGFEWNAVRGGYRCRGGTHFVSETDPALFE